MISALFRNRSRGPIAGYSPECDDLYDFNGPVLRLDLRVVDGRFELPPEAAQATSALLKARVTSTTTGKLSAPRISFLLDGRVSLTQQLDTAANGTRYFDVSELLTTPPGKFVQLQCEHARVAGDAELLLFTNRSLADERVLVLAPHPDDAEIAAYGLYKHTNSAVVTITAGDAGGNNYQRIYPDRRGHELKSLLRVWNSISIPLLASLAPERVANLGYFDETLGAMYRDPQRTFMGKATGRTTLREQRRAFSSDLLREDPSPTWESLVADLGFILDRFQPTVMVAPHPLLDAHPDHRYTFMALMEALSAQPRMDARLLLYSNHPVYCTDWPFGLPTDAVCLPPWPVSSARLHSFFSHPLTLEDQVEKLFALDAMHDLRRAPPPLARLDSSWVAALWEARDAFLRRRVGAFSYFRRAVRPREIFFEYPAADAALLYESQREEIARR